MSYFAGGLLFKLDTSLQWTDTICFTFSIAPHPLDSNVHNNTTQLCIPISAAYDPNIKVVSPTGSGIMRDVAPGTQFTYTVFFQNTGNSFAEHVRILDYLPNTLDISKLQVVEGSRPFTYNVFGNTIEFRFRNIFLPDSNTNEPESHGWVTYTIPHVQGLALGTQIRTWADIFFEYNPPIRTDTTLNTINLLALDQPNVFVKNDIMVFPNPAQDRLLLKWEQPFKGIVLLYDLTGRMIHRQEVTSTSNLELNTTHLPNGMYLLQTRGEQNQQITKKFVVHH